MIFEEYIDLGMLFKQILLLSRGVPILFSDGEVSVNGVKLGIKGCHYEKATLEDVIRFAYRQAAKQEVTHG